MSWPQKQKNALFIKVYLELNLLSEASQFKTALA